MSLKKESDQLYGCRKTDLWLQCVFRVNKKHVFHNAGHKVKMGLTVVYVFFMF